MKKILLTLALVLASYSAQAASLKISDMTDGAPMVATDCFPAQRGSGNVKICGSAQQLYVLGNNYVQFTGPATSVKTFTLPNSSATILYSGGALGTPSSGDATNLTNIPVSNATGVLDVAHGGTGGSSVIAHAVVIGNGTSVVQTASPGTTGYALISNGASADPSFQQYAISNLSGAGTGVLTALGVNVGSAGAPVLFNGAGGTPSSITLTNATGTAASLTAGNATLAAGLSGTPALPNGTTATTQTAGSNDTKLATDAYADTAVTNRSQTFMAAISDQTTTVTAATSVYDNYPFDTAITITGVHADCKTAPTGTMTIDINEAGTSILSTKLTIDANENSSYTAATPAVISDASFAAGARLSVDVDSTTGGIACEVGITYHQ